jgi:hypothetical protein
MKESGLHIQRGYGLGRFLEMHGEMSSKCFHEVCFWIHSKKLSDDFRENVCFIVLFFFFSFSTTCSESIKIVNNTQTQCWHFVCF